MTDFITELTKQPDFKPFKAWYCNRDGIPELITVDYILSIIGVYFWEVQDAINDYLYDVYMQYQNDPKGLRNFLDGYNKKIAEWKEQELPKLPTLKKI